MIYANAEFNQVAMNSEAKTFSHYKIQCNQMKWMVVVKKKDEHRFTAFTVRDIGENVDLSMENICIFSQQKHQLHLLIQYHIEFLF